MTQDYIGKLCSDLYEGVESPEELERVQKIEAQLRGETSALLHQFVAMGLVSFFAWAGHRGYPGMRWLYKAEPSDLSRKDRRRLRRQVKRGMR